MKFTKKIIKKLLDITFAVLYSAMLLTIFGCSTSSSKQPHATFKEDPFEKVNRKIYTFNRIADKAIIRPVAKTYNAILPNAVQKSVTHFFNNLWQIHNIANDTLQADVPWLLADIWRFTINTTIGIGGLFDPATVLGLPKHSQDFGMTLAKWGYTNSSYIMLPILGPSTVRDTLGLPVDITFNVSRYIKPTRDGLYMQGVNMTSTSARLLNADSVVEEAFDPYVFIRDAYLQTRAAKLDRLSGHSKSNLQNNDVNSDFESDTLVTEKEQNKSASQEKNVPYSII